MNCRTLLLAIIATLALVPAHADTDDLSGGVLLVHAPPGIVYSSGMTTWCDSTKLEDCEDQITSLDTDSSAVAIWFILSAWDEEKSFSAVEFGLGDFDPESFGFTGYGICLDDAMALYYPSTNDWPGPNTGIAIAASGDAWAGQLVPIYWFAGLNYAEADTIAITVNPATEHAGWLSETGTTYDTECLGALGLGAGGTACCPTQGLDDGIEGSEPGDGQDSAHDPSEGPPVLGPYVPRVVLAKIGKEALVFPLSTKSLSLSEARSREDVILDEVLASELEMDGVLSLTQCIPDFNPIVIGRGGLPVYGKDGGPLTLPNDLSLWFKLTLSHDDVPGAIMRIRSVPGVLAAEPSHPIQAFSPPNDPLFAPQQWNLNNVGQYCGGVAGMDLNVMEAWEAFGDSLVLPVDIAVLDYGILRNHPDLPNILAGYDFVDDDGDPSPGDGEKSHGTECAGVIGMKVNNGIGGAGLAYGASIYSVRVLGVPDDEDLGGEPEAGDQIMAAAINWATHPDHRMDVISMSVGAPFGQFQGEAFQNARQAGIACVQSAGNQGDEISLPIRRLICHVNAFIFSGERWRDILLPPYTLDLEGSNYGDLIDLTAPGGSAGIVSTLSGCGTSRTYDDFTSDYGDTLDPDCDPDDCYVWDDYVCTWRFQGTSASAPHVSAVLAAILSRNLAFDGEDAQAIACSTAVDHIEAPCTPGWDPHSGFGRPDLYRAMLLASTETYERVTALPADNAVVEADGEGWAKFVDVAGINPLQEHHFWRWKVSQTVSLQHVYELPIAWGRVQGSVGWRYIDDGDVFYFWFDEPGHTTVEAVEDTAITVATWYYDILEDEEIHTWPDTSGLAMSFTVVEGAGLPSEVARSSDVDPVRFVLRPNPAQVETTVLLEGLAPGADTRVDVLSIEGRVLRRLETGPGGTVKWDLRDEGGKVLPSGVYFIRAAKGLAPGSRRLVLIR